MKTITIKINLDQAQALDVHAQLNPSYIGEFIQSHLGCALLGERRSAQLPYTYTLKVPNELHKAVKIAAMNEDLTMSEYVRQLFQVYYTEV